MDTIKAFILGAASKDKTPKVFDWDKAAKLISERNPKEAQAGLSVDEEWTAGIIFRNGKIVMDSYTYLASTWATPVLILDGVAFPCYVTGGGKQKWDSDTKWPDSAQKILRNNEKG